LVTRYFFGLLLAGGAVFAQSNSPARATVAPAPAPAPLPPATLAVPPQPAPEAPALPDATATGFWRRELATARRVVDARTYDITSVVRWHMQPTTPERPLKAWVLVIGTPGQNTAYGWEVHGFIDGQRQPTPFIIRNPPKELLTDFQRRSAAYAALQRQQSSLRSALKPAQDALAETEAAFRRAGAFRVAGDLLDLRGQAVKDIEAGIAEADEALQRFDTLGLDMTGPFVLRCFAMKTALTLNGRPVYDHGTVLK
jgi:hypothetical protein